MNIDSSAYTQHPSPANNQTGVGLIEVIIAMLIFTFAALSVGNSNTLSLGTSKTASVHGSVNILAHEMLEILKADKLHATSNAYDIEFEDVAANGSGAPHVSDLVNEWRARIAGQLPGGVGQIECQEESCTVSLRWRETVISGQDTQTYNLRSSL